MNASSEFILHEVDSDLPDPNTLIEDFEPVDEHWQLALQARERWLKGEEEVMTFEDLKKGLRAELGWKS